jgi:hypothetical protein
VEVVVEHLKLDLMELAIHILQVMVVQVQFG